MNHTLIKSVNYEASRQTLAAGGKRTNNQADSVKTLDLGKTNFKILGEIQTFPDTQGTASLSSRPGLLRQSKRILAKRVPLEGRKCVKELKNPGQNLTK